MSGKDTSKGAARLDERIDAALASWPMPDRGAAGWESLAVTIEERIARAEADATGDAATAEALLDPPLPATPPEVQQSAPLGKLNVEPVSRIPAASGESKMSQPPERGRDRRSLKDLAKLASSPSLTPTPPPSKASSVSVSSMAAAASRRSDPGDSGIVDLKMMSQLDPQAGERAKDTKLASSALFDEEDHAAAPAPASAASPSSSKEKSAPASSPAVAAAASSRASAPSAPAAAAARAAPKADEGKSSTAVWVAGIAGLFAAAAAAVFMLQSSSEPTAVSPPPAATVTAKAAPSPKPAAPPQASAEAVAAADTAAPAEDPGVDIANLPPAANAKGATGAKAVAAGPKKTVTVPGLGAAPDKPPATHPSLVANIPTGPGMGPADKEGLDKALRQAAGPTDNPGGGAENQATAPIEGIASVPQKPSAGAIAGGVSAAMSQARACLGLDDPISRAAVTFESTGAVQSVTVSGFASGKPAEACIKAALGKAKIPPFAQPIYTQTFTVRPNS